MSDFVDYSRGLLEAAKGFRTHALGLVEGDVKQAFLRASLLHSCSYLEAHLNYMTEHFTDSPIFSLHEKGVLLEREIRFDAGEFKLTKTLKISRITDRIDLLLSKCSDDPSSKKAGWYSDLNRTLKIRNSLVHPKDTHALSDADVKLSLTCMLHAVDTLYTVVFKKGLPHAKKGIDGGLDFATSAVCDGH